LSGRPDLLGQVSGPGAVQNEALTKSRLSDDPNSISAISDQALEISIPKRFFRVLPWRQVLKQTRWQLAN
jgi:hypothetical protein